MDQHKMISNFFYFWKGKGLLINKHKAKTTNKQQQQQQQQRTHSLLNPVKIGSFFSGD